MVWEFKMKEIKCKKCGIKFLANSRKKEYCSKCIIKIYQEVNAKKREERKKAGLTKYRNVFCTICGGKIINVYFSTKYCEACKKMITEERRKEDYWSREKAYKALSEEEKERRITIISKKIRSELDKRYSRKVIG